MATNELSYVLLYSLGMRYVILRRNIDYLIIKRFI